MKKQLKFFVSFAVVAMLGMMVSCDPAEGAYTEERYVDNIYTVNKATVQPEFADTTYFVSNIEEYGLQTGDRAHMVLRYYFDAYSGEKPQWSIVEVVDVIPTRELSALDSTVFAQYNTPVDIDLYELWDAWLKPMWIWKNRQNISVKYTGLAEGADFKLMVRGVSESEAAIEFDLVAKTAYNGGVKTKKLLTFGLDNVGDFLTASQKNSIATKDSVRTKIYYRYKTAQGDTITKEYFGGKIKNTFK